MFLTKLKAIASAVRQLVHAGNFVRALDLFSKFWNDGKLKPDCFIFPDLIKASSNLESPSLGLILHSHAIKLGYDSNSFVSTALLLFYGNFGNLEDIDTLFEGLSNRNIVTWTAAISAYSQNNQLDRSIQLFHEMRMAGISPNSFTMAALLPAFTYGREISMHLIHGLLIKCGFESDNIVSTAFICMLAKSGMLLTAHSIFDRMRLKNLVSWNSMILGYAQNGRFQESLQLFVEMQNLGTISPDSFSVVTALCCCSGLSLLGQGKEIHGYAYRVGFMEGNSLVNNAIIDMYGKCGVLEFAERVFCNLRERDVASWTALINSYGLNGKGDKAIHTFEKLKENGEISPNSVTLTTVLSACSHCCMVGEGFKYFRGMSKEFGIQPNMKHYSCMVDLLTRAGFYREALKFINEMPISPGVELWQTLLGAATIGGDRLTAEIASKHLMEREPWGKHQYDCGLSLMMSPNYH